MEPIQQVIDKILSSIENLTKRVEALEEKKPKKERLGEQTAVGKVRTQFLYWYEKKYGRPYVGWGAKENGQAASWLRSVSLETALTLCEFYFKWPDARAVQAAHSFSMLVVRYVELNAWVQDKEQHNYRVAHARVSERVQIRAVEDVFNVRARAEQTRYVGLPSEPLRKSISEQTEQ